MGVTHKLVPELIEFIVKEKKNNPGLSCRTLSQLIDSKFQIRVSKSSVNQILKEAGLSQPVGRKPVKGGQTLKERIHLALAPEIAEIEPKQAPEEAIKQKPDEEAVKAVDQARENERLEKERLMLEEERLKVEQERLRLEAEKAKEERARLEEEKARTAKELEAKQKAAEEFKAAQEAKKLAEEKERQEEEQKLAEEKRKKEEQEVPLAVTPVAFDEIERACPGLVLLKAVDYLLSGSRQFGEIVNPQTGQPSKETAALNEGLVYYQLLQESGADAAVLSSVLGADIQLDKLQGYLARLEDKKETVEKLSSVLSGIFKEIRCLKVIFADSSFLYLDADLYTTWSTQYTPYDFSNVTNKLKSDLGKYFLNTYPLVLFMAPGYDFPSREFMSLIINFNVERNNPQTITLYDNKLSEVSTLRLAQKKDKYQLVFGLWPWQFVGSRAVKSLGEFSSFKLKGFTSEFFLADVQLELTHPETKQKVLLGGCALKNSLSEQTRLVILTNSRRGMFKLEELAQIYLSKWPNQEETFQDYSRKVELFTYTADSQKFLSEDFLKGKIEKVQDIKSFFSIYLELLDLYLKWHFLPMDYEEKDFATMKSRFYDLSASIIPEETITRVNFTPPAGYAYTKDLEYLFRRLNERNIELYPGKPVKFFIG